MERIGVNSASISTAMERISANSASISDNMESIDSKLDHGLIGMGSVMESIKKHFNQVESSM